MSIESVIQPIGDAAGAIGKTLGNIGGVVNTIRGLSGGGSGRTTRYINMAGQSAGAQADIAREQARLAREQWATYKNNFLPLEKAQAAETARDMNMFRPLKQAAVNESLAGLRRIAPLESKLVSDALKQAEPDIAGATADASAQVRKSFAKVRDKAARDARSIGLQPARLGYLGRLTDLSQAASEASARTMAARDEKARAEDVSWNRLGAAIDAHRGLPSLPASSLGPANYGGLGSKTADRAIGLLRAANAGYGDAAGGYSAAGRQMAPVEASSGGIFDSFAPTTDLADAWVSNRGVYGLPMRGVYAKSE